MWIEKETSSGSGGNIGGRGWSGGDSSGRGGGSRL